MGMEMKLTIEGMHCAACVNRVTNALQNVPGVQIKQVDIGSAEVVYDERAASSAMIEAALKKAGYASVHQSH